MANISLDDNEKKDFKKTQRHGSYLGATNLQAKKNKK